MENGFRGEIKLIEYFSICNDKGILRSIMMKIIICFRIKYLLRLF